MSDVLTTPKRLADIYAPGARKQSERMTKAAALRSAGMEAKAIALLAQAKKHEIKRLAELDYQLRIQSLAKTRRQRAPGFYDQSDINHMMRRQDGKCATPWCGASIVKRADRQVDHKTPISRGGSNWPDNLQLLCSFCNGSKGSKTQKEWLDKERSNVG